jgi:hypothetical protein
MSLAEIDQQAVEIIKKEAEFMGFFQTAFNKYYQTIFFVILITILVLGLRYIHIRLQYSENKMIINWFGLLIILNVILSYVIIIMYQQIQLSPGIPGPEGVQGPPGDSGENDYCTQCSTKIPLFEPKYEDPPPKQPLLPDKLIVEQKQFPMDTNVIQPDAGYIDTPADAPPRRPKCTIL